MVTASSQQHKRKLLLWTQVARTSGQARPQSGSEVFASALYRRFVCERQARVRVNMHAIDDMHQ